MCDLESILFMRKSICLARFSPSFAVALCCEMRIYSVIRCGEQPLPRQDNIN